MKELMLSTIDNPYNPFKNFNEWLAYDIEKGYGTCELLAMIAKTSDSLSESENQIEIDQAIKEIIKMDPNFYISVENKL